MDEPVRPYTVDADRDRADSLPAGLVGDPGDRWADGLTRATDDEVRAAMNAWRAARSWAGGECE